MPTYILTDPKSGDKYKAEFDKEPTDAQMRQTIERIYGFERGKSLPRKGLEFIGTAVGPSLASGTIATLGAVSSALSDFNFIAGDQFDKMGIKPLGTFYRSIGETFEKADEALTGTSEEMDKAILKDGTAEHLRLGHMLGKVGGQLVPTLPFSVAGGAIGRGLVAGRTAKAAKATVDTGKAFSRPLGMVESGALWSGETVGALGASTAAAAGTTGAFTLQEAQQEYLKRHIEEHPDMTPEELRLMAISSALPVTVASAAKTGALTLAGGVAGGWLMGSLGPEALGVGSKIGIGSIGRTGKFGKMLTTNPWGRGVTSGAIEGLEEGIDEGIQAVLESKTFREDMTEEDKWQRVKDGMLAGFVLGGLVDGGMSKYIINQNNEAKAEVRGYISELVDNKRRFDKERSLDRMSDQLFKQKRVKELEKEAGLGAFGRRRVIPEEELATETAAIDQVQREALQELTDIREGKLDVVRPHVQKILDDLGVKTVDEAFQRMTSPEVAPVPLPEPAPRGEIIEQRAAPRRHAFDPRTGEFRTLAEGGVLTDEEGFLAKSSFVAEEPTELTAGGKLAERAEERAKLGRDFPPQSEGGIGLPFKAINLLGMKQAAPPPSKQADIRSKYSGMPLMDDPLWEGQRGEIGTYGTEQPSTASMEADPDIFVGPPEQMSEAERMLHEASMTGELLTSEQVEKGKRAERDRERGAAERIEKLSIDVKNKLKGIQKKIRGAMPAHVGVTTIVAQQTLDAAVSVGIKVAEVTGSHADGIAAAMDKINSLEPHKRASLSMDQRKELQYQIVSGMLDVAGEGNVGVHYGDTGTAGDTKLERMAGGRGTGHFGTGTYFLSRPKETEGPYAKRPMHRISLEGVNLLDVDTEQSGRSLHKALKNFNGMVLDGYYGKVSDREITDKEAHFPSLSVYLATIGQKKRPHWLKKWNSESAQERIISEMKGIHKMFKDGKNDGVRSPSTYLMQKLGFDGIDVRKVPALDNTEFGSVVYEKPFKASVKKLNSIRKKLSEFKSRLRQGQLFARVDIGMIDLAIEVADAATSVAIKSMEAGDSVSDAISKAYEYVNNPDLDLTAFGAYMSLRLSIVMEQMLKGATAESAINASQVPMNNLTLAELKDGVGAKGPSGIKDARSWMGGVKRYFGGTSDYVAENSAFMGLSQAIISHTNLSADYQGRLMAMLKNGLTAGQIEAAGPEFEAYWRAKEEKKELPALSPEAQQLVSNWQDIAEYTGNVSTEQGVWVKEGSKKRKGKYTLGRDYFIRAIRPDYGRILSKLDSETKMNDSLREIGDILKSEKLIEKVSVDEILKWKNRNSDFTGSRGTVQTQINNFFANLEKARGTKSRLPSAMLDYGVGAVERYIYNWSERMAQIQAYGQALASKDNTDLFDVVENNLNSHNYTKEANYIKTVSYTHLTLPTNREV